MTHSIEYEEIYKTIAEVITKQMKANEVNELMERTKYTPSDKINLDRNKYPRATTAEIYIIVLYMVEPKLRNHIKESVPLELFATDFNKRVLKVLYDNNSLLEALGEFTQEELRYIAKYLDLVHEYARTKACVNEWVKVLKATKRNENINLSSDEELTAYFSEISSQKQSS